MTIATLPMSVASGPGGGRRRSLRAVLRQRAAQSLEQGPLLRVHHSRPLQVLRMALGENGFRFDECLLTGARMLRAPAFGAGRVISMAHSAHRPDEWHKKMLARTALKQMTLARILTLILNRLAREQPHLLPASYMRARANVLGEIGSHVDRFALVLPVGEQDLLACTAALVGCETHEIALDVVPCESGNGLYTASFIVEGMDFCIPSPIACAVPEMARRALLVYVLASQLA